MTTTAAVRSSHGNARWAAWAAATWSLGYGVLGLAWSRGAAPFPWGARWQDPADPGDDNDLLMVLQAEQTGPVVLVAGLVGVVVAVAMGCTRLTGIGRLALLGVGGLYASVLLLILGDARVLMAFGYTVPLLLGSLVRWPPVEGNPLEALYSVPVLNQLVCMVGGFLWLAAVVVYQRRTRDACVSCGRDGACSAEWTSPVAAARWGRWAVYVAAAVPLLYAVERLAWAAGIPLGGSADLIEELRDSGLWVAGAALAVMALVGVAGAFGLIRPWGEVWPRWVVGLAGRPVPAALPLTLGAVVSASLLTLAVPGVVETIRDGGPALPSTVNGWLGFVVPWLFPVWGAALGAATLAYHYRRRGACRVCGRGPVNS